MHKVYMGVAPSNIANIFELSTPPNGTSRRDPQYFANKYNRLRLADYSISYIGPRLYNNTVNEINTCLPRNIPKLQDKFINSFKANVVKHLLYKQKLDTENISRSENNFVLYSLPK